MQRYILFSIFLIFSCSNALKENKTDWAKENLSGKVKKYIEHQYKPLEPTSTVQGAESLGLLQKNTRTYNEKGYCTEITYTSRGGDISSRQVFEYDDNNLLIKKQQYRGTETSAIMTDEFKYDANGKMTERRYYDYNKLVTTTLFQFDAEKKSQVGTMYAADNTVITNFQMQYDDKDNLIDEARFDQNNEFMSYRIFNRYDENSTLRSSEHYQSTGNKYSISLHNEKGQEIALRKYTEGIIFNACLYEYDEKGNQIQTSCDIYENQRKRNVQSINKYEYDKEGNWTKRITFQDNLVTYVVERTYVYY